VSLLHVYAATKTETDAVIRAANENTRRSRPTESRLQIGPNEALVVTTGMGPRQARARADESLSKETPEAVIITGSCGSLTRSLVEGSVVIYTECLSADGQRAESCSASLADSVTNRLRREGMECARVVGITTHRIATTTQEKLDLAQSGASAVDMESYEVVAAATARGIPSVVLRVVSDSVERALPDFNRVLKPNGEVNPWALLRIVLGSPLLTAKLVSLNRKAMATLTPALRAILSSDWTAAKALQQ
jgi:nucleoside phosphorylase